MKSIILSVQPQWLAKILNGEKTIEIRKSAPKELPCEVYFYCTMGKPELHRYDSWNGESWERHYLFRKPIVGEWLQNGLVVAKFTLNKVDEVGLTLHIKNINDYFVGDKTRFIINKVEEYIYDEIEGTCLTVDELHAYGKGDTLYAWHIDNLVIFDKPMELKDFIVRKEVLNNEKARIGWLQGTLTRAPQSFCYCEPIK